MARNSRGNRRGNKKEPADAATATDERATPDARFFRGYIDEVSWTRIQGWVWDPQRPEDPIALDLVDGDNRLARVLANLYRAELVERGVGDGRHAFTISLDEALLPHARHVLQLRHADTGAEFELEGPPLIIERAVPDAAEPVSYEPEVSYLPAPATDAFPADAVDGRVASSDDVKSAYNILLFRDLHDAAAVAGRVGMPVIALIATAVASLEFRNQSLPHLLGTAADLGAPADAKPTAHLRSWLLNLLSWSEEARMAIVSADTLASLALEVLRNEKVVPQLLRDTGCSSLFDQAFYSQSREAEFSSLEAAIRDYLMTGAAAGADPIWLFDSEWYDANYVQSNAGRINPLVHFILVGTSHLTRPHPLFDAEWYLRTYPEVSASGQNPLVHYLEVGELNGWDPMPLFDSRWYTRNYLDVIVSGRSAFRYFLDQGSREGHWPNPLFDPEWYLDTYPDVKKANINPLLHYVTHGAREGRRPNSVFDSEWYLRSYPDVGAAGLDPFIHFCRHGLRERRLPGPDFDPDWYKASYPDVEASGLHPLFHYLAFGRREGRATAPAESVKLDNEFQTDTKTFHRFQEACIHSMRHQRRASYPIINVVVSCAGASAREIDTTVTAAAGMESTNPIYLILLDPPLTEMSMPNRTGELARHASDDVGGFVESLDVDRPSLTLFLRAGDRPHSGLISAIATEEVAGSRFILVDLFAIMDGKALPILLPGMNPVHAMSVDYFFSRYLADTEMIHQAVRTARVIDPTAIARQIIETMEIENTRSEGTHLPVPLIEIREPQAGLTAVRDDCAARPVNSGMRTGEQTLRSISVVIPTDNEYLAKQIVRNIIRTESSVKIAEIILVVGSGAVERKMPKSENRPDQPIVSTIQVEGPFNFSAKCNAGAQIATSDILLFLNDDIIPISDDWIECLLEPFSSPRVAVTGPLLLYPDGRVQHAGMYFSQTGDIRHALRFARLPEQGYGFLGTSPRLVSIVTGAVLAIRRQVFVDLNGFDHQLAKYIQDVDLCLRILHLGLDVVFTPRSVLIHMESVAIKGTLVDPATTVDRGRDYQRFMSRWADRLKAGDAFYNRHFDPGDESMQTLVISDRA